MQRRLFIAAVAFLLVIILAGIGWVARSAAGPDIDHEQLTATPWQADEVPGWMEKIEKQVPEHWNQQGSPHRIVIRGWAVDIWTTQANLQKISVLLGDELRKDGRKPPD